MASLSLRQDLASTRLNLGCGDRTRPDWVNADMSSSDPTVLVVDLRRPLPFADGRFRVVYHSHVLEHLDAAEGRLMLAECFRALAPGGALRVVLPDLELLANWYQEALRGAVEHPTDAAWALRHRWAVASMLDQCSRDRPGGEVLELWRNRQALVDDPWIASRAGMHALGEYPTRSAQTASPHSSSRRRGLITRLRASLAKRMLTKEDYAALRVGRFRLGGESHKYMYDRVSLGRALKTAGFGRVDVCTATTSHIEGFDPEGLDVEGGSRVYKPESLYVEAFKQ